MKLELLITRVRHIAPHIEIDSRSTQRRPRNPERDRIFRRQVAYPLNPVQPDGIVVQQTLVLVHLRREVLKEVANLVIKIARRLHAQTADADVAGHHALAAYRLKNAHQLLALAEAIEKHRQRANVHSMRAEPDQMRLNARQLIEQHAEILCP